MRIYLRTFFLAQCILIVIAANTQDTIAVFHNTIPTLNGHRFVPQALVRAPFIQSELQMSIGAEGTVNLTIPPLDILPDTIEGIDGSLAFVIFDLQYDQRIKDWISFYLRAGVSVRTGTELGTLLAEGLNTLRGVETGLLFNLLRRQRHQLSGVFSLSTYNGTVVNISQFVADIINGAPNPSLTYSAPALSVGVGATYAFGISEIVGMTATSELHLGENISRGNQALRVKLGTSMDFNWVSRGTPLGVSIGYLMRSTADYVYTDNSVAHTFSGKVAYTAAPDFVVGIELTSSILPLITIPEKARSLGVLISINYYFN